jgi:SAM-dependent methyltransferase
MSANELYAIYAKAPFTQRLLASARHLICPTWRIVPWIPDGATTLDVGCGKGSLLFELAMAGKIGSGLGCDIDGKSIAIACSALSFLPENTRRLLRFVRIDSHDELPDGEFNCVSMVDVLHHVPPAFQKEFFYNAAGRVKNGGRLIYKDMVDRPWWQASFNRIHDALIARQRITYIPLNSVGEWARDLGLNRLHFERYSVGPYGHHLTIYSKE